VPIIHLVTKIMTGNTFKMFAPHEVDVRGEVSHLIRILYTVVRDEKTPCSIRRRRVFKWKNEVEEADDSTLASSISLMQL